MTEETKNQDENEEIEESEESGDTPDAPDSPDGQTDADTDADTDEAPGTDETGEADQRQLLEAEVAELKDKLLRAMAETENVRRRAERDKQDASKYAITAFARDILSVADNLKRALEHAAVESGEDSGGEEAKLKGLLEGVGMTEREMLNTLERAGVTLIEAQGKRFDHNYHEALFEIEDLAQPAGTVTQVMEAGYMLGDRLLRPAKVGVSKGGPKSMSDAAGDAAGDAESPAGASSDPSSGPSSDPSSDPPSDPPSDPRTGQAPKQAKAYEKGGAASGGKVDEKL